MNNENFDAIELGEIKTNPNYCDCCLTHDDLTVCPLENCEYTICKTCKKKLTGTLCPACRREIKQPKIKKRTRRVERMFFFCVPISRSTAEKILCLRYLLFAINLLLISRLVWFLIFKDKPFFHNTWFLSTLGGIIILVLFSVTLIMAFTILGELVNCIVETYYCLLYDDSDDIIYTNCVLDFLENKCVFYIFCCLDNCLRREIHYITDENDTYMVSPSDSDYSSGEDSLDLD